MLILGVEISKVRGRLARIFPGRGILKTRPPVRSLYSEIQDTRSRRGLARHLLVVFIYTKLHGIDLGPAMPLSRRGLVLLGVSFYGIDNNFYTSHGCLPRCPTRPTL